MASRHMETGRAGEDLAASFLTGKGYRVLATNYRFQHAEIDIIAFLPTDRREDGGELVFVEVKTRRGSGFGYPEEAVTHHKQRHLIRAARAWLRENRMERALCRFDVIGIILSGDGESDIQHLENAFWTI
jgi:putative endonuclease